MKLIEVVVLTGAHCISPVQHTGVATEVAKVECAVVIEKDTQAGTVRIVPAGASDRPEVVAVLERLDDGTRIEPAFAPPNASAAAAAPPPRAKVVSPAPQVTPALEMTEATPPAEPEQAVEPAADEPEKAETKKAATKKAEPRKPERKKAEATKEKPADKSKCIGEAKPKWYTTAEGRRKYRCVLPG